jgi:hypothetical protein
VEETVLGRLARWALALGTGSVLAGIGLVALLLGSGQVFWPWWVGSAAVGLAAAGLWRLAGRNLAAAWRRLRARRLAPPPALALFAVFFLVKAVFALHWRIQQRSDFLTIFQAAQSINAGDYSFAEQPYWFFFAYQTPFAIYEAFMLKVFGGSTVPLLVVSAAAMAGTNLLVFGFARRITGSTAAGLFAGLAYLAYPGPYLEAAALTNDHLSAFLLLLGAYLVLRGAGRLPAAPGWGLVAAGGAIMQLGNLARPAGVIVCLSLTAALALTPLVGRQRGTGWRPFGWPIAAAAVALGVYAAVGGAAGVAVKASGINPQGVANHLPEWKFIWGLEPPEGIDPTSLGMREPVPRPDARQAAQGLLDDAVARLPQTWAPVAKRQVSLLWAQQDTSTFQFWPQPDYQSVYAIPDKHSTTVAHYLVLIERGVFLPAVAVSGIGAVLLLSRRRWPSPPRLPSLAVFLSLFVVAYACVHLVIEVQPRYRYLAMPAILALTGPAWQWLITRRPGRARRPRQGPHRLLDRLGRGREVLVLPEAQHPPTGRLQPGRDGRVPFDIPVDLGPPVVGVGLRQAVV